MSEQFLPISLDIETSGLDPNKNGIVSIGAIYLNNSELEFYEECKLDIEDEINEESMKVNGFSEKEMRDENKQSQKQLIERFFEWVEKRKIKNFLCQNPQFDVSFLGIKANKYKIKKFFHHRAFDLHSIAQTKYHELNNKFLIKEYHSDMSLTNTLKFCGLEDNRGAHNALEDCKLTAECFSRLMFGKNLFEEYVQYKIPEILTK